MPRYRFLIEYDGSSFSGWQRQNGEKTVQGVIEDAIDQICHEKVELVAAGRTDAGVHALGQVAHADLEKSIDPFKLQEGINHFIRPYASILKLDSAPCEFHARFSAERRIYRYLIVNRRSPLSLMENRAWHLLKPLDVLAMQKAACHLLGHHDFTSFRDSECQSRSPVKTLDLFQIQGFGELISAEVRSKSFLHHQVRIMMGTMVQVGLGKMHYDDMPDILNAKDRRVAGPTAPACGLYFVNVEY